jgi:O-acetylserine/cysteine efflux transporter
VPVFGMSSAALLLGENIGPLGYVAAVLLVGGVAVTSFGVRASAASPAPVSASAAVMPEKPTAGRRQGPESAGNADLTATLGV